MTDTTPANETLQTLLDTQRVWRGTRAGCDDGSTTVSTGHETLDGALPGGGWPTAALTEIVVDRFGSGELRLVLPALARLSRETSLDEADRRWVVWVAPPCIPYAPALAAAGLSLSHMLLVDAGDRTDRLWAAEQSLRSGACAAVMIWASRLDNRCLRRLQLAAEEGACWGVLFRPPAALAGHSPAMLRLRLSYDRAGARVSVLKSRGGRPQQLLLQI